MSIYDKILPNVPKGHKVLKIENNKVTYIKEKPMEKTKEEIREWVESQFYADIDTKTPSEDYESFDDGLLRNMIQLTYNSLCRFLKVE